MKMKLISLFLLALSSLVYGQNKNPFDVLREHSYFDAYQYLIKHENEYLNSDQDNQYLPALGTLYSFVGQYEKAKECFMQRDLKYRKLKDTINVDVPAGKLDSLYEKYNVVLFNECHHVPMHRAFVCSQLETLKENGFKYLALEALASEEYADSNLVKRTYPILKETGFYTNDPVFGLLIRKALKLGFELIPYESNSGDREKNQAENIFKQYKPEKGKLVVLAGYAHIMEIPEVKMMGYYLKEKLSEDVLSLSQYIPGHINPSCDSDLSLFKELCHYDYYVYHRPLKDTLNIPFWYKWLNMELKPLKEFYSGSLKYPCLVTVSKAEEKNGVPVYQYLAEKNEDVLLAFPGKGKYSLNLVNVSEKKTIEISVD